MPNSYFQFKQFIVYQDRCAMKVTTDACLFGAWVAEKCRANFLGKKKDPGEPGAVVDKSLTDSRGIPIKEDEPINVLDIGTGTGLLALMIAQGFNSKIDAIEIDKDAFLQAKGNFEASDWANRLRIFHDDVTQFNFNGKYEVIVSNPPFYENQLASSDRRKNLAMHGSLSLNNLIKVIKENIEPAGTFFLLLPFNRHEEIKNLFTTHEIQLQDLCFVRQSVNHDYFRIMLMGKLKQALPQMTQIDEIAIMDEQNKYSSEFIRLLKDYYLNLPPHNPPNT